MKLHVFTLVTACTIEEQEQSMWVLEMVDTSSRPAFRYIEVAPCGEANMFLPIIISSTYTSWFNYPYRMHTVYIIWSAVPAKYATQACDNLTASISGLGASDQARNNEWYHVAWQILDAVLHNANNEEYIVVFSEKAIQYCAWQSKSR